MAQSTETKLNKRFDQNIEITGTMKLGVREETTPGDYTSDKITLIPPYHTGGPFYIKTRDDASNAYMTISYGANEVLKIKHDGTLSINGSNVLTSIPSEYLTQTEGDARYLVKGGSWNAGSMPGSRWGGFSANGGEVVFQQDNPNSGQMSVMVDGNFYAGENNGFWSLYSGNNYNSKVGFTSNSSGHVLFNTSNVYAGGNLLINTSNIGSYAVTSETDTLDSVADRGNTTNQQLISTNPAGFRIDSASHARIELDSTDNWSYIRMQDQGVVTWDIACYNSGNLEWRPGGGATNRMSLTTGGSLLVNEVWPQTSTNSARFSGAGDWGTRHYTSNGYIQFGPANNDWAHIYTDRPNFYFNKELYVNNYKVFHYGNDGAGSGLDADLLDGLHASRFLYTTSGAFSGDWNTITDGDQEIHLYQVNNITNGSHSNYPTGVYTYGSVLGWQLDNATFKMYASHTGDLVFQTGWNNDGYSGWRQIMHTSNIGSYAAPVGGSYGTDWYVNALYYDDWLRNTSNTNGLYWQTTGWHLHPYNSNDFTMRSGSSVESTIRFANSGNTTWGYIHNDANKTIGFLNDSRNWVSYTTTAGHHYATGSSRAPVFYDSNDTTYYTDPNGGSVFKYLNVKDADAGRSLELGPASSARTYNDTSRPGLVINADRYPHIDVNATSASDVNATHGAVISMTGKLGSGYRRWGMGIAQYNPNELSFGYYDNQANPHYGVGINWSAEAKMWIDTGGHLYSTGSMQSPIFYDRNNTGYYIDPSSTSKIYNLELISAKHTYLYINPGNGYEAMVRFNGGQGSTWYVGSRTTTDLLGSQDAFHVYSQTTGATVGGYDYSGNHWAKSSSRATIFYDQDNTGYYINPNGDSNLYGNINMDSGWLKLSKGHSDTRLQLLYDNGTASQNAQLLLWASEPGITYHGVGIGANISFSGQHYGRRTSALAHGVYMRMDANNGNFYFETTTGTPGVSGQQGGVRMQIDPSGNVYSLGSSRAPIFYDYNNTGYYCNPNGQSKFNNGGSQETLILEGEYPQLTIRKTSVPDASIHFDAGYAKKWNVGPGAGGAEEDEFGFAIYSGPRGTHYGTPLRINAETQNVMVGDADHPAYKLDVQGTIRATGDVIAYSDARVKENIKTIDNALDKVNSLRGVEYNKIGDNNKSIGVIAQEVQKVLPEVVKIDDKDMMSVAYGNIVGVLIEAVKELTNKVEELENKLNGTERRN